MTITCVRECVIPAHPNQSDHHLGSRIDRENLRSRKQESITQFLLQSFESHARYVDWAQVIMSVRDTQTYTLTSK